MPWHARAAGAWRTVTGAHVRVSGVWQAVQQGWVRDGGVWRQFYSAESLVIPTSLVADDTVTYNPPFVTQANVSLTLASAGTYQTANSGGVVASGNWISPTSAASNYEALATIVSGSWSGSAFGTWVALSSNRSWTFSVAGPGSGAGQLSVQIRRVSVGTPSVTATFDATGSCT